MAAIDSLGARRAEVLAAQQVMSKEADSLAQAIARIKARPSSPLEQRALNAAYRQSQTLAESLQWQQAEDQRLDRLLRQKAEALLKNLSAEIEHLASSGASAKKSRDHARSAQIAHELQICRDWQKRCREILEEPPPAIIIYEVHASPEDDAVTLQRKADFLRDQSDRLAREVQRLDQKLAELRSEAVIRDRMSEFAYEVSLFEPLNEGVRSAGSQSDLHSTGTDNGGGTISVGVGPGREQVQSFASESLYLTSLGWPAKVSELSARELRGWQKKLQNLRAQRKTQADSLNQRAQEIEQLSRSPEVKP